MVLGLNSGQHCVSTVSGRLALLFVTTQLPTGTKMSGRDQSKDSTLVYIHIQVTFKVRDYSTTETTLGYFHSKSYSMKYNQAAKVHQSIRSRF